MARHLKGGEQYRVYSVTECLGTCVGGKVHVEPPGDTQCVDLKPSHLGEPEILGICGDWDALPRKPKIQSTSQKVYQDAVGAVLDSKGLSGAKVNVTQVIRVDLDGDGQEEVLVSAKTPRRNYPEPDSQKNDYSLVLLRKIVAGKTKTFVLCGEYYPKFVSFNAPNVYKVAAVLDFNGDGVMEVAVSWSYYEGGGIDIYSVQNGKVDQVLSGGSGA